MQELHAKILFYSLGKPLPQESYYDQLRVKFDDTKDAVDIFESYINEEVDSTFLFDNNLNPLTSDWVVFEYKDGHTFFVYPVDEHSSGVKYVISNQDTGKRIEVDNKIFGLQITMMALEKLSAGKWYPNPQYSQSELDLAEKEHNKRVALYNDYHQNLIAITKNVMENVQSEISGVAMKIENKLNSAIKQADKKLDD